MSARAAGHRSAVRRARVLVGVTSLAAAVACIGRPAGEGRNFYTRVTDLVAETTRGLSLEEREDLRVVLPAAYGRQTVAGVLGVFQARADLSTYARRLERGIEIALESDPAVEHEYATTATQARVARLIVETAEQTLAGRIVPVVSCRQDAGTWPVPATTPV